MTNFFVCFVVLMFSGSVAAQNRNYNHLDQLVSATEEMQFPEASENGKWLLWNILKADGGKNLMIQHVNQPSKKFERKNMNYRIFLKDKVLIQTGNRVEILNLETGQSNFLDDVSNFIFNKSIIYLR
ncbi:hypothetical protein [Chryseobacterium indoltheticum]|uniref:hypothetical protein n=1 Tax=Chryseobacterium indoltheticum TaxID=254 RepID=UPI003F495858